MRVPSEKISVRLPTSRIDFLKQEYQTDSMTDILNQLIEEKLDSVLGYTDLPQRPPFSALGGKQKLAASIVRLMPEHQIYVEPFGNTAALLLRKPQSHIEVYNDIESEVVNFFEVLRDDPVALIDACGKLPYAETAYHKMLSVPGGSQLDRAVRYFYLARCGFLGVATNKFNTSTGRRNNSSCYYRAVDRLWSLAKRFRGVEITCRDYATIIRRYADAPTAFFMIDAPYLDYDHYYTNMFSLDQYKKLVEQLGAVAGKFMVCHSRDQRIDDLFCKGLGCNRVIIRAKNHPAKPVSGERPNSNLYLYMNY